MIQFRYFILVCLGILFFINTTQAQRVVTAKTKTIAPTPKVKMVEYGSWSFRVGGSISALYLAKNIKDHGNGPGYCGGIGYEVNNFLRISSLYTYYKPSNIAPTWQNIKANTFEINLEIVAGFPNKKTLLYPFVGLSYNTFKGFFTGQQDYLNLHNSYLINSTVSNKWLGLNLGSGLEHNFGIIGIYIDYRMRVGKEDKTFNVIDICYTGGVKIRIPGNAPTQANIIYQNPRYLN